MDRKTLLVGSIPAGSGEEAMRQALREVGPHLLQLPDGETGDRDRWVGGIVDSLRSHPDLEVRREGAWSGYDDPLNFAVRKGHRFTGEGLDLGHVDAYRASRPVFDRLRAEHGRPDLSFQVGIPGDFDMALFTFGLTGPFRHRGAFTDATVREIEQIHAEAGDDVLFQVEVPAELVFVAKLPVALQPAMAAWMGGIVTSLARRAPRGARFGVHLCLGDLGHKALCAPRDAGPLVKLTNAVVRRWPVDRPLEYVHVPLAAGEDPPPLDEPFYRPLAQLQLPPQIRLVAGFLHEDRSIEELRRILAAVESHVGSFVDVAASCGLGRRGVAAAGAVIRQSAELCATSVR